MEKTPSEFNLLQGEEVLTSFNPTPQYRVVVTNQRVILWQWSQGVENVASVKLSDVRMVEVMEKRGPLWPLGAALVLGLGGAALLPWLVQTLANLGEELRLYPTILGVSGFILLVAGLVLLGRYLRRAFFPDLFLVFWGAPALQVPVGNTPSPQVSDVIKLIQRLKQERPKA